MGAEEHTEPQGVTRAGDKWLSEGWWQEDRPQVAGSRPAVPTAEPSTPQLGVPAREGLPGAGHCHRVLGGDQSEGHREVWQPRPGHS